LKQISLSLAAIQFISFLTNMCASALAAALLRNQHEIKRAMGRKTPLSVLYAYGQTECTSLPVVTEDNEN